MTEQARDTEALIRDQIANWPTFPQLWVNGELIGGSDIILDMFQKGELQPLVEQHSPAPEA